MERQDKSMEVASELMGNGDVGCCQQPGVASADDESELDTCHRLHLDCCFCFCFLIMVFMS